MADIYGYAKQNGSENSILVLRDKTGFIECGCRFKYIPDEIPMNYKSLTKAIFGAIDKEAAETGNQFVTDERMEVVEQKSYDFDALTVEFQELVGKIMTKNQSNAPKISAVVSKYLGKGKKVSDATPEQAEFIYLINTELKEDLLDK